MRLALLLQRLALLALAAAFLAGCASQNTRHTAVSVVDYLYPNTKDPIVTPGVPLLTLPLRVGVAFVPGTGPHGGAASLTEKKKNDLMEEVAGHFRKYAFVKSIELIPSAYLRPRGSFANLDQLRTMYGVDVIALLSYDQVQFTDQGALSLTYWTIVGAYVVPGEKNDTTTMLDAVVYDIASRKMLFRAPGVSSIKGRATLVNLSEELRRDSEAGFDQAARQMVANLDAQLALFREKVKARPEEVKIQYSAGYTGGGDLGDLAGAAGLLAVAALAWWRPGARRRGVDDQ